MEAKREITFFDLQKFDSILFVNLIFTESETIEECTKKLTAPVIRRQKTAHSNTTERSVRRISYLKATANDMSLQESEKLEESVNEIKDEKIPLSDELQMLIQFFKRNATTEKVCEHEHEGKLSMKIAYIENEKAVVRQWYRILAKLCGDKLQITILTNETEEVSYFIYKLYKYCYRFHIIYEFIFILICFFAIDLFFFCVQ